MCLRNPSVRRHVRRTPGRGPPRLSLTRCPQTFPTGPPCPAWARLPGRCPYRTALKLLIRFDVSASVEVQVASEFRLTVFG